MLLLVLITLSFAEEEPVNVWYCNNNKYTIKDRPELKRNIPYALDQLQKSTPQKSTNSDIKYRITCPSSENPVVYASSFCKQSSSSECGHCLRVAKNKLLHQCLHAVGAQFYSELCFLRYELYDFFAS
ncbi:hypothetical protein LINPERHAP1_LOCUS480 [Linum perenne]